MEIKGGSVMMGEKNRNQKRNRNRLTLNRQRIAAVILVAILFCNAINWSEVTAAETSGGQSETNATTNVAEGGYQKIM
jgi:hypothetical protein